MPFVASLLAAARLGFTANGPYAAVARELTSRCCPTDKTVFLGRLGVILAVVAAVAVVVSLFATFKVHNVRRKEVAYLAACSVVVFAIGGGVLTVFGLSGCGGATEAGLTWDWPW